ncbi:MAG: DUF2283 domain-containing protein [candidate division NC10 bacterium]|nr:DUF2283 domain-containing protein [candidate division NC10 bacterium]MDE2321954.1 DUF2283 domain-containing protein [candidate division NC10 bacterium]
MKIEYSKSADALYVYFKQAEVAKSKELEEGVVLDLDADGHLIGIEILDASIRIGLRDLVNVSIENLPLEMVGQG